MAKQKSTVEEEKVPKPVYVTVSLVRNVRAFLKAEWHMQNYYLAVCDEVIKDQVTKAELIQAFKEAGFKFSDTQIRSMVARIMTLTKREIKALKSQINLSSSPSNAKEKLSRA